MSKLKSIIKKLYFFQSTYIFIKIYLEGKREYYKIFRLFIRLYRDLCQVIYYEKMHLGGWIWSCSISTKLCNNL